MTKKFVYFYFMKNMPEEIGPAIPLHIEYWKKQKLENYSGGPFADRTGGLIIFESSEMEKAIKITDNDPFNDHDMIENKWVKEWIPE